MQEREKLGYISCCSQTIQLGQQACDGPGNSAFGPSQRARLLSRYSGTHSCCQMYCFMARKESHDLCEKSLAKKVLAMDYNINAMSLKLSEPQGAFEKIPTL